MLKECRPICQSPAETCSICFTKIYSPLFYLSFSRLLLLFILVLCERGDSPKWRETPGKACRGVRKRMFGEGGRDCKSLFPLAHMQIWARLHSASSCTTRALQQHALVQSSSVSCAWWEHGSPTGALLGAGVGSSAGQRDDCLKRLCEAFLSLWALQVALKSLQACKALTSLAAFLEIIASSASICSPGPGVPPMKCLANTRRSKQGDPPHPNRSRWDKCCHSIIHVVCV